MRVRHYAPGCSGRRPRTDHWRARRRTRGGPAGRLDPRQPQIEWAAGEDRL